MIQAQPLTNVLTLFFSGAAVDRCPDSAHMLVNRLGYL
jgi:hypothetical protein